MKNGHGAGKHPEKAQTLRQQGKPPAAAPWWVEGEYTGHNKDHN
jgi:hypothetical protein